MSTPFLAEVRIWALNFAPRGWAFCNGQLLSIQQNTALFAILGTNFGGNSTSNFGLPNLQDRVVCSAGQGPGLSQYFVGETTGTSTVTLLQNQMPTHTHALKSANGTGKTPVPSSSVYVGDSGPGEAYSDSYATALTAMSTQAIGFAGTAATQPHNNVQPGLGLYFSIALQGIFPSRN
jgi:microcystin-dependent protein